MMIGTMEIVLITGIAIVLFGASKIPELAKSCGRAIGEFKKSKLEVEKEIQACQK